MLDRMNQKTEEEPSILSVKDKEKLDKLSDDFINNPPHYTRGGIEPLDYILQNNLGYLEGNIIKYITRYKFKNGLEDLEKAQFYLNKLIEGMENE